MAALSLVDLARALVDIDSTTGREAEACTDIPLLDRWGEPLLFGPGSVLDAHTDGDHVAIADLEAAVDAYEAIARTLLREASARAGLSR